MSQAGIISVGGSTPGVLDQLSGNNGTATADASHNIDIVTANSTVKFVGASHTITQDFGLSNLALGSSMPAITSGGDNVALGRQAGQAVTSGGDNVLIGSFAGNDITTSEFNVAVGTSALLLHSTATANGANTAIGYESLVDLGTGSFNTCLGQSSGANYTSTESSNICIANRGVLGESNVIRIGTQGSTSGDQNQCFIAGIEGSTVAGPLVNINSSGKMGQMAAGTTGQILQSAGASATPTFSTATYPSTAGTSGTLLQSNGTNIVNTTATYPATAGTALNILQSNGTNFVSTAPIWMTAFLTLTNSQIKNIHGTPVQIIATPGPGLGIVIQSAIARLNYGGNNAFTAGASQTIALYYNNTTTAIFGTNSLLSNSMITSTANKFSLINTPSTITALDNQIAGVLDNVNVALYNSVATEISGNAADDNTIDVYVTYTIVTF